MHYIGDRLMLGTAQFGSKYGITNNSKTPNENNLKKIISLAKENQINSIDTAMNYNSEIKLGNVGIGDLKVFTKLPKVPEHISVSKWVNENVYKTITNAPLYDTTIENAELIKVAYNTLISTKIAFSNTLMELCHKLPNTNVDDVTNALKLANRRLISGYYMDGGMGDGGGCHPRDNIAMSYLSEKLNISHNWFEHIMKQRENQTEWLAKLIIENSKHFKINILGKSFKSESNLTLGSPAILLKNILQEKQKQINIWDPIVDGNFEEFEKKYQWKSEPQLFFIATKHDYFNNFPFYKGSIVIDPWRYIIDREDIELIRIGDSK